MSTCRRRHQKARTVWQRAYKRLRRKLQRGTVLLTIIPPGPYCYTYEGEHYRRCPYWSRHPKKREMDSGYCSALEMGDWMHRSLGLLWDQVKECGLNKRRSQPPAV